MKIRSPKSYSYKREIILHEGDLVKLKDLTISDTTEEVKLVLQLDNKKIITIEYSSIYDALEDGWNLETI